MAGRTVVAVFEKVVPVVVVVLLPRFDLFRGDVLLRASNQKKKRSVVGTFGAACACLFFKMVFV